MGRLKSVVIHVIIIAVLIVILMFVWGENNNIVEDIKETNTVENIKKDNDMLHNILSNPIANIWPSYSEGTYGTTENGRNLMYYSLAPAEYEETILLVFAIHGYEDAYDKDGEVLVKTAEYLIEYYKVSNSDLLNNNRLIIVPCANPDGLYDGYSNNGFGRCNAKGIDLNRDFDVIHKVNSEPRNYTTGPFSATESRALADLVEKEKPSVVIDFHGWLNYTIGDENLAKIFTENMNLEHKTEFNNNCNGYFSYWAHEQGASALLVEFKDDDISRTNLITTINKVCEEF